MSDHLEEMPYLVNFVPLYDDLWDEFGTSLDSFLHQLSGIVEKHLLLVHKEKSQVSISFSNDQQVQNLNRDYRDKDQPTNVLSFTNLFFEDLQTLGTGEEPHLGDMILAYETILHEAQDQDKNFLDHTKHLIVHGFLHIIGYDHMTQEEESEMESLEIEILQEFNINNPYE
jgi:probable rRNA maturation factor